MPNVALGYVNGTSPPSSGDWIISDNTYVYNETIVLNGSIIIENGGKLTLENVTLKFNCTFDGQFNITVKSGGSLNITRSTITAWNPVYRYFISVFQGAHFNLSDSNLSYGGYSTESDGLYSGLYVEAEHSEIRNNKIQNFKYGMTLKEAHQSIVDNNTILNIYHGIFIYYTHHVNVTNNYIYNAEGNGIYPVYCHNILISDNEIVKTKEGIWLDEVENSTISYNKVHNQTYGMNVWHVHECNFLFNEFYYSTSYGWPIWDATDNVFMGNKIHNTPKAIQFWSANNNTFYLNDFYNNTIQIATDSSKNFWDNGTFGNYWDDYNGPDADCDGIGDTPYVIDENNKDNYPLMYPSMNYITGPVITNVDWNPKSPLNNESVTVGATVTDINGVDKVLLWYTNDTTWYFVEMTHSCNYYEGEIPPMLDGTTVKFKIFANDSFGNPSETDLYSYTVNDTNPPTINGVMYYPAEPTPSDNVTVNAQVEDPSGVSTVILMYSVNSTTVNVTMTMISENYYFGVIPAYPEKTLVRFKIFANDTRGNYAYSEEFNYTVRDVTPPTIYNVTYDPEVPVENETVTVTAKVNDSIGVSTVLLMYVVEGNSTNVTMQLSGNDMYTGEIPGFSGNTEVQFKIFANDTSDNWASTEFYNYTVKDLDAPVFESVAWSPEAPYDNESVVVRANVTDPAGISTVILYYTTNGTDWILVQMVLDNSLYVGTIPSFAQGTTVQFKIFANDTWGNYAFSSVYSYTVLDTTPPKITNVSYTPTEPLSNETVTVSATVVDNVEVDCVLLFYYVNATEYSVLMEKVDDQYIAEIPAMPEGTSVQFKIFANDTSNNFVYTGFYNYTVADITPPSIYNVAWYPESPLGNQSVNVTAEVWDFVSVDVVILSYRVNDLVTNVTMVLLSDSIYYAIIPLQTENETVYFRIIANDTSGNLNTTGEYSYIVTDVTPPNIHSVTWTPESPTSEDTLVVTAIIDDNSTILEAKLWYNMGTVESFVLMTKNGSTYTGSITNLPEGDYLYFKISAIDSWDNCNETDIFSIFVQDVTPPTISNVMWDPEEPTPDDNVTVYADVYDPSGVAEVILSYNVSDVDWVNVTMNLDLDGRYYGVIPAMPAYTTVLFKIIATDNYGNTNVSEIYSYQVSDFQIVPGDESSFGNSWVYGATAAAGTFSVAAGLTYLYKKKKNNTKTQ